MQRIKYLQEEVKMEHAKNRELEEKIKKDEKTYRSQFDHMINLEDKLKDLKSKNFG